MSADAMVKLGDFARDKVSGFQGTVTGTAIYLTGVRRVLLAPYVGEHNSFRVPRWFDAERVVCLGASGNAVLIDEGSAVVTQ